MPERPYVLISVATSIDGYIDDASGTRLILSGPADLDRVDEVRAGCDAILVGAGTIRRDNPALLVRSARRRAARADRGQPASPVKVTLTRTADLDPAARFFTAGPPAGGARAGGVRAGGGLITDDVTRLVYVPEPAGQRARDRLGTAATVIAAGERGDLRALLADLRARGVRRLLVEGGNSVFTQFLAAGLADELHLAIAPLLVGDPAAPRFAAAERISDLPADRIELAESRQVGDVVLARYLLSGRGGAHGQAAS